MARKQTTKTASTKTSRRSRKTPEIAGEMVTERLEDAGLAALAEQEAAATPRRGRKGKKATNISAMAVHLDPADLNARLASYLYEADPKRMDVERLERWARANGLWQPSYDALDSGRRRMCTGIRARKKLAAGEPLVFPD